MEGPGRTPGPRDAGILPAAWNSQMSREQNRASVHGVVLKGPGRHQPRFIGDPMAAAVIDAPLQRLPPVIMKTVTAAALAPPRARCRLSAPRPRAASPQFLIHSEGGAAHRPEGERFAHRQRPRPPAKNDPGGLQQAGAVA